MIYTVQVGAQPIFRQIVDRITHLTASGALAVGEVLPSVRDLARTLTINPNTVQRAYGILADHGIIVSAPGVPARIAATPVPVAARVQLLKPYAQHLQEIASDLRLGRDAIIHLIA